MVIKRIEPLSLGNVAGVLYGALGLIAAIIAAWLYNLAAGFAGGIEIDAQ